MEKFSFKGVEIKCEVILPRAVNLLTLILPVSVNIKLEIATLQA